MKACGLNLTHGKAFRTVPPNPKFWGHERALDD